MQEGSHPVLSPTTTRQPRYRAWTESIAPASWSRGTAQRFGQLQENQSRADATDATQDSYDDGPALARLCNHLSHQALAFFHISVLLRRAVWPSLQRVMVSTRPSPTPAKGRISYPSATNYTAGDEDESPSMIPTAAAQPESRDESTTARTRKISRGASDLEPIRSRDSERDGMGLKQWWKGFRDRPEHGTGPHVFGVPLSESIQYASVQISTAGPDGNLFVWG